MSKQVKDEDTGEMPELSLADLMKAQREIRDNVNEEREAQAREAAIKRFGLVERSEAGKPSKKDTAELDTLRTKVATLEADRLESDQKYGQSLAAFEARVMELETENADLKSRLTPPPAPAAPVVPTPPADPVNPFATA